MIRSRKKVKLSALVFSVFAFLLFAAGCNFAGSESEYDEYAEQGTTVQETPPPDDTPFENENNDDTIVDETYSPMPDDAENYDTASASQDDNAEDYSPQEELQIFEPIIITEYMRLAIDNIATSHGAVGVQVAIIQNGEIIGTHEFGYATRGSAPMREDTKIRVASLTKPILAMLAMRLHEEGLIDIDADIGDYWGIAVRNPNYPDIPITIRYLMTHTSSMRSFDFPFQSSELAHRNQIQAGNFFTEQRPGEINSWYYNNFAYCFLGVTLEIATGETVNAMANRFFFEPLGIDAAFGPGNISDTDNLATLYRSNGNIARSVQALRETIGSNYPGQSGLQFTGGLTISASDYAKLMAALIGNGEVGEVRILSAESVELLKLSQGTVLGEQWQGITSMFNHSLALRWWTNTLGQEELFWHTGGAFGVAALTAFNPINGNGVIVVTTGANLERLDNYIHIICAEIAEVVLVKQGDGGAAS